MLHALRAHAHEQQYGETEGNGRNGLQHQVVGSGSLELGVDFAQQNHAVAGGAGEHAEHGEEPFVLIVGIEVAAAGVHKPEGDHGPQGTHQQQRQPDAAQIGEVDGGGAGHNHKVEAGAGNAVEGVVVDILALHQMHLAGTVDDNLEQRSEDGAPQEVETPEHGLERLGAEVAQVHLLHAIHEEEHHRVDQQHQADLHGHLVDRLGMWDFVLRLIVGQRVLLLVVARLHRQAALAAQDVHIDHPDETAQDKARGGNAEAEVGAVESDALVGGKAGVGDAEVEGLSGSLSVAHGQQQARGIEEIVVVPPEKQRYGDEQTDDALNDVGAGGDGARLHHLHRSGLALNLLVLEGHGHETQSEGMIGDNLHGTLVDQLVEESQGFDTEDD